MSLTKQEKAHGIIHGAAGTAAAIGAGLAQAPCSDSVLLVPLQVSMVSAIALVHGRKLNEATATAIIGTLGATVIGRAISQVAVGWVPGLGNAVNASTAAALTETIGWSAHKFFDRLGEEPLSDEEIVARAKNS